MTMQANPVQESKALILLGGGHSHVAVLHRFAIQPMPGLRLTLISRDSMMPYSGMLPGHLAGRYTHEECHIDLRRLANYANACFIQAEADGLDLEENSLRCKGGPSFSFDLLSIDIGSEPQQADAQGVAQHAIPVRPISGLLAAWQKLIATMAVAESRIRIGVVGGGLGGVELALNVQYRLREERAARGLPPDDVAVALYSDTAEILRGCNSGARARLLRILAKRKLDVYTGCRITEVRSVSVHCEDGRRWPADAVFWVTNAAAPAWLGDCGLATDTHGFILVNDCLQSTSHSRVFATGDIASSLAHPRPKSGVFAVRQGPPLSENLRRALLGLPLTTFKPQRRYLSLVGTGDGYAVAARGGWSAEGRWVWKLKDWIDRRFLARYNVLPS